MIFVDTGAWIALSDRRDQHHADAIAIYTRLKQRKERLLTTDYLIDETVTRLRYDLSHSAAVKFLDFIERTEKTGVLTVVRIDETLFQEAKTLFRQYDSAKLSFTDCTSVAVCQVYKISESFAFDQHFTMMGITLLRG
ncbi:type II toxin-antitoxin system VapC family toxin [Candidatus Poribacteria bacterium]|nr:type II toxin-antitoxin system VapC family toxin [Candidatus Poribacteria bacterium]